MDRDEAPGEIAVRLVEQDGYAVIEARDNGLGWPTPNRERLTEPYMTTREKGTGLGLAIVKRVMEDHKGRLELDVPEDGQGAIVRLIFPLADTQDAQLPSMQEA
jgi:two-component system nitrogen regulation sensor histidine kinase NtrY